MCTLLNIITHDYMFHFVQQIIFFQAQEEKDNEKKPLLLTHLLFQC